MPNLSYQQTQDQSCGAACLMVAAKELGITHAAAVPTELLMNAVDLTVLDQAQEMNLYMATSNSTFRYSMPAHVGRTARNLGLDVDVYMYGCVVPPMLRWIYPSALTDCGTFGIAVHDGAPPDLAQDERLICVMGIGGGILGMHYVLYRPDGSYMDPATNHNYAFSIPVWGLGWLGRGINFARLGQGPLGIVKYIDLGIYIKVAPPGV